MEYYVSKDYKPRYVIPFDDVDGNHWKVSIQEPNFVGNETTLTGGEFPVMWEGEGDESQEEVVLGSTGRLSIVCLAGQESLFTVGNILPREINDRRVQVLRDMGSGNWYPYWQGFIKPETLSQDWDSAPYEIELPIVSAVAAMEYFLMPLPNQAHENMNAYDELFFGVTNIAGLLRAIIAASGCDFRNIITNWSWYYDMTGEVKMIPRPGFPDQYYEMHWTQGTASSLFFYDVEDGVMQPKTFKDVLENICYPYGKIHEYGTDFAVMMRTMDDAATVSQLFYMPVWEDYETGELSDEVRFITYTDVPLYKILMSDVLPAGTDNAISNISAPSLVSFRNDVEKKKEIFELTDKFIKPTLPLGDTWAGKPIISNAFNGMTRYLYCIDKQYVDLTFADNWLFQDDRAFCRVIEAKGESNDTVNYDITAPLAFCFNRQTSAVNTKFSPKIGFLTRPTRNRIKLTLKCWYFGEEDSINGTYMSGPANAKISFLVKDETASKYLNYSSGSWVWEDTTNGNDVSDMTFENGECTLMFNEPRGTNDNSLHKLSFTFAGYSNIGSVGTYGQLYMTFKLEYVKNATIYEDVLMNEFGGSVLNNGNNQTLGGNGEKLEINFETMAGKKQTIDGSMMLPANSFCNSKEFIDMEQREKIEIEAAQFERYTQGIKNFDFALNYIVVKDGQKVFIPVAVGMNPRMNTLKLTLVSTKVTSGQPVPPTPQDPEIAWSAASASATIGGTNTFPTLSNPHSLPITYSSSDTSVATVDSSGVVTLVAAGSANISASFAGSAEYYASTVTYALAVEAANYIQDGLVFHLDGINKGDDANAWTDLIGGVKFAYNSHSTVNTDNVEMDGSGCIVANGDVTYPWNTSTIEICFDRVSNSSDSAVFFPNKANYIAAILNPDNTKVYTNAGTTSRLCFSTQYQSKSTISFNQSPNIVINGEIASYTTFNDWYAFVNGYASIGGRNNRSPLLPYKGKIYAIRIYNRLLSSAEMIHNQQVDNQRFNLGLNT